MQIGVIGSEVCPEKFRDVAEEVGRRIAENGAILICGGLGGVMESAARGAKKAGGTTIGILPGFDRYEANKYIDIAIVTGMSHARNVIVVRSSDALIAVAGSYGTLSEIALGLKMKKPVIVVKGCPWEIKGIIVAEDAEDAVKLAIENIKSSQQCLDPSA
ncbi:MAG: TIGR00725 family protein [Methanocellales archaeon]|nr:TIGR00725 family protein [Methanocellales archaeon]